MSNATAVAKHTPGPWEVDTPLDAGDFATIVAMDDGPIVIADLPGGPLYSEGEGLANARLIAAAPEMFEVVKRTVTFLNLFEEISEQAFGGWAELRKAAEAVIAKAEGRQ
jgi:hypothetical protein